MFKDRLKELRIKNNLTQEELAKKIFVSRSAVCKWEMGNGIPSDVNIEGLCQLFNVSKDWLLDKNDLYEYINSSNSIKRKVNIISIVGAITSILCFILSFVGLFYKDINNSVNMNGLLIYYPSRSIFNILQMASISFIVIYVFTFCFSIFNILKIVKEDKYNKMNYINVILIILSIVSFVNSFIVAIVNYN